jgi:hypothetical protein
MAVPRDPVRAGRGAGKAPEGACAHPAGRWGPGGGPLPVVFYLTSTEKKTAHGPHPDAGSRRRDDRRVPGSPAGAELPGAAGGPCGPDGRARERRGMQTCGTSAPCGDHAAKAGRRSRNAARGPVPGKPGVRAGKPPRAGAAAKRRNGKTAKMRNGKTVSGKAKGRKSVPARPGAGLAAARHVGKARCPDAPRLPETGTDDAGNAEGRSGKIRAAEGSSGPRRGGRPARAPEPRRLQS